MNRTLLTAVVIALFVSQNFVFCCGHVHTSGHESDHGAPHLHLHDHPHDHDHSHHHHEVPTDREQNSDQQDPHDCVIKSVKQDAIIPDNIVMLATASEISCKLQYDGRLLATLLRLDQHLVRLTKHLYWHQSSSIHLQVCAQLN